MSLSIRAQFAKLGIDDLSGGVRSKLNPFFQDNPKHFPYKPDGADFDDETISIHKLIFAFDYPSGGFVDSYVPNNSGTPEFSEECQGLTAGPTDWFITSNKVIFTANPTRLYRVPFQSDLTASTTWPHVGVPASLSFYDHFGDPVFYSSGGEDFVLVPCDGDASHPDIVMRFEIPASGAPTFRDSATLARPPGVSSSLTAWSGYDPATQLYYCTEFCNSSGLAIHCFEILSPFEFQYRGEIAVQRTNGTPAAVLRIQGGAASPISHLWLVADTSIADGGGLRCVEIATGTLFATAFQMSGAYQSTSVGCDRIGHQEYEGVCFADMDVVSHHSNLTGQLHWVSLQNDYLSDDNVTIAHFSALPAEKQWI